MKVRGVTLSEAMSLVNEEITRILIDEDGMVISFN